MGLFLGPMVVTAFIAFWDIYRRDYQTQPEAPSEGKESREDDLKRPLRTRSNRKKAH
jgi:hypothetical protein